MSPLISAAELQTVIDLPDCRVVDCRHDLLDPAAGQTAYLAGHLPGAVFAHLDRDLSGPCSGRNGRHPLPDPARLAETLSALGIGTTQRVVAYDAHGGAYAARLWWLLRWLGHPAVQVLDGGLQGWLAQGGKLSDQPVDCPPAEFVLRLQADVTVDAAAVLANLPVQEFLLIDARAPGRFAGQGETLDPVAGHIPGARNRFFQTNLAADGCFKSPGQLRAEWLGLLDGRAAGETVQQCGSGVTACHNLLALELAGLPGARLYPGSWSEWCSDPARPVAVASAP